MRKGRKRKGREAQGKEVKYEWKEQKKRLNEVNEI